MATVEKVKENPFDKEWKNSDVIIKVGDQTLHLHSYILSHYSPVFQAMLNGNFKEGINKEIELKGKQSEHVIQMFKFFYAELFPRISGNIDFENMLPLFQEYQLEWLMNASEKRLQYNKTTHTKIVPVTTFEVVDKLYFSEEYGMKKLMENTLVNPFNVSFQVMQSAKHWNDLSMSLRQKVAFKRLSESIKPFSGFHFHLQNCIDDCTELEAIKNFLKNEFDRLYDLEEEYNKIDKNDTVAINEKRKGTLESQLSGDEKLSKE